MKSTDTVIFTADLAASVLVKVSLSDTKLMGGEYFNKSAALGRFYTALIIMVMSWCLCSLIWSLSVDHRQNFQLPSILGWQSHTNLTTHVLWIFCECVSMQVTFFAHRVK